MLFLPSTRPILASHAHSVVSVVWQFISQAKPYSHHVSLITEIPMLRYQFVLSFDLNYTWILQAFKEETTEFLGSSEVLQMASLNSVCISKQYSVLGDKHIILLLNKYFVIMSGYTPEHSVCNISFSAVFS
jgi:hypothetical protein